MWQTILGSFGQSIIGLVSEFIEDKDARNQIELKIKELEAEAGRRADELQTLQAQANIEAAKHPSIFVAGARPFILWVAGIGVAYVALIAPLLTWACAIWWPHVTPPEVDSGFIITLLGSVLGLGGLRTYEKQVGVARDNLHPKR